MSKIVYMESLERDKKFGFILCMLLSTQKNQYYYSYCTSFIKRFIFTERKNAVLFFLFQ